MKVALKEAMKSRFFGDVPVGAVIVHNNKIIAKGYNKRNKKHSSIMHAEVIAIHKACRKMHDWRLEDCTMYVTLEPCPMCAGAIMQARMKKLVYGATSEKAGSAGEIINILQNDKFNHKVEITSGVMKEECSNIIKEFFIKLRMKNR